MMKLNRYDDPSMAHLREAVVALRDAFEHDGTPTTVQDQIEEAVKSLAMLVDTNEMRSDIVACPCCEIAWLVPTGEPKKVALAEGRDVRGDTVKRTYNEATVTVTPCTCVWCEDGDGAIYDGKLFNDLGGRTDTNLWLHYHGVE